MHTSAFDSCRIHHNGGYDGDIFITNKDSTSKPVGELSDIKFTCEKLINFYHCLSPVEREKGRKVTIIGDKEENYGDKITILAEDIESFMACRLIDIIQEKINSLESKEIFELAQAMGIQV
jgi:hypothetical protein